MLRSPAEALSASPDGRSASAVSFNGRTLRYWAGASSNQGRFRQETGLLALFGDGRQGYSFPDSIAAMLSIWGILK